ncbi:unnamed protein product [Gongylonema pulchrum]|uniref:Ig-like domain-containing protein n=1 Tax=Gongylonema pulchrum TaxID=637853 RepID=A0A183CX33_9BILA|nr:unnamed protein product [Gongylonema pulchrum]
MPTAVMAVTRLIEEAKVSTVSEEAAALLSLPCYADVQLSVRLERPEQLAVDKFEEEAKVITEEMEKEVQKKKPKKEKRRRSLVEDVEFSLEAPVKKEFITEVTVPLRTKVTEETVEFATGLPKMVADFEKEAKVLLIEKLAEIDEAKVGKKKKKIPKSLVIPPEINSKFGDKSTLLSETTVTTELAMNEESAEVELSPKKPLPATVTAKVDSAKPREPVMIRPDSEEFTFTGAEEPAESAESLQKLKQQVKLPLAPKVKEEMEEVDFVLGQGDRRENAESTLLIKLVEELAIIVQASAKKQRKAETTEDKAEKKRHRASELVEILASFSASEQREFFDVVALHILSEAAAICVHGEVPKRKRSKLMEELKEAGEKKASRRKTLEMPKPVLVSTEATFIKDKLLEQVSSSLLIGNLEAVTATVEMKKRRRPSEKPKRKDEETAGERKKDAEKLKELGVAEMQMKTVPVDFRRSEESEECDAILNEIFYEQAQRTVAEVQRKKVKKQRRKEAEPLLDEETAVAEFTLKAKREGTAEEVPEADERVDLAILRKSVSERPAEVAAETEQQAMIAPKQEDLYEHVRKKRSGFIQAPDQEIIVFRGDTVKIECELVNDEDELMWFVNGKPAEEISRCTAEVDSFTRTLKVADITPEDSEMKIIAKLGDIVAETVIRVEDTPAEIVERLPWRTSGKFGEDITLSVTATHPAQTVTWKINGEELPKENYVTAREGNLYKLTIINATYEQAGRYSVNIDSSETSTTVIVEGAPVIEEQLLPDSIDLEVHENLILNIPFKAAPEPTVQCFLDDKPLPVGAKLQLDIIGDTVRLCKRKTTKYDSGEYTVKICNEFGEVAKTFTVNVKGMFAELNEKQQASSGPLRFSRMTNSSRFRNSF